MKYIERVKNVRSDLDIKQYEIAEELGILPKTYSMYENGYRNLPIKKLDEILLKFDMSLDYILGLNTAKKYDNMRNINLKRYADNLQKTRKHNNLSQKQMSKIIGCSQQALSEYENGNLIMPLEILKLFCIETNISADYITGRVRKKIEFEE